MTSTQTVFPDADIAGDWEGTQPSPVDAGSYTEPTILGIATAGYLSQDSLAASDITDALSLPDIGEEGGGSITYVGGNTYDGSATYARTHAIPLPAVTILAGDLIEIMVATQDANGSMPNAASTAVGYTQRWFKTGGTTSFRPELTKLYKIASGGESGSVTVTLGGGPTTYRAVGASQVWRGVDQTTPYDVAEQTVNTQDPASITTVTDGALVTVNMNGNRVPAGAATVSSGYTETVNTAATIQKSWVNCYKEIPSFGADNPGAYTWGPANVTTVTDALRPAAAVDLSLVVIGVVADGTVMTAQLGGADVPTSTGVTFVVETDLEIPSTSTWRPQAHVWTAPITTYTAGNTIDITVSDHESLHSWAAILLVVKNLDNTVPIEDFGTEGTGWSAVATFGTVTPTTAGAKALAILAKTPSGWHYEFNPGTDGSTPLPSTPLGYTEEAVAVSDAIVAAVFLSPPLPASQVAQPLSSSWTGIEDWTTGLMTLQPATAAVSTANLYSVVNNLSELSYIEMGTAAGNMDEVLELDLSGLPAGAVITGVSLEISHASTVQNLLRVELVALNVDDTRVRGGELKAGYAPSSPTETSVISTGQWLQLDDGTNLHDYTRLGVRLFSTERIAGLNSHKIYSVQAHVEYEEGGPLVSNVTAPDLAAGEAVTWDYSSLAGLGQTHYEVMVIQGGSGNPLTATAAASPIDAAAGEIIYRTGKVAGPLVRSLLVEDAPLTRGLCTWAVRAWARLSNGSEVVSAWAQDEADIIGAAPTAISTSSTPAFNPATGGVDLTFDTPATTMSRVWVLRSEDEITFEVVKAVTVAASQTDVVISDYDAPLARVDKLAWQLTVDNGAGTETATSHRVGGAGVDIGTPITSWYMIAPDTPALNFRPDVVAGTFQRTVLRRSVTVGQPGNSLSVSSPTLGSRISMTVRTKTAVERAALEAILDHGEFRLVNILGQEWWVKVEGDEVPALQIWKPLDSETTQLRDGHLHSINLVEVAREDG